MRHFEKSGVTKYFVANVDLVLRGATIGVLSGYRDGMAGPGSGETKMTEFNTLHDVQAAILEAGYSEQQIARGIEWAETQDYDTYRDLFTLVMSRILLGDDELADGSRFSAA